MTMIVSDNDNEDDVEVFVVYDDNDDQDEHGLLK